MHDQKKKKSSLGGNICSLVGETCLERKWFTFFFPFPSVFINDPWQMACLWAHQQWIITLSCFALLGKCLLGVEM